MLKVWHFFHYLFLLCIFTKLCMLSFWFSAFLVCLPSCLQENVRFFFIIIIIIHEINYGLHNSTILTSVILKREDFIGMGYIFMVDGFSSYNIIYHIV